MESQMQKNLFGSVLIKMYENQTEQKISGGNFEWPLFTFQMDNITEARDGPKDYFALLEYDGLCGGDSVSI